MNEERKDRISDKKIPFSVGTNKKRYIAQRHGTNDMQSILQKEMKENVQKTFTVLRFCLMMLMGVCSKGSKCLGVIAVNLRNCSNFRFSGFQVSLFLFKRTSVNFCKHNFKLFFLFILGSLLL